ncbi:MAG: hypothetical protein ACREJN_07115 [Nitrospiraceae bacterium]
MKFIIVRIEDNYDATFKYVLAIRSSIGVYEELYKYHTLDAAKLEYARRMENESVS